MVSSVGASGNISVGGAAGAGDLLAQLRAADRDRYLACLLMPEGARADIATLFLFNAEIAAIRDRVSEPLPGEIRLQWWRDVIAGERGSEAAAHPLAQALLDVMGRHRLSAAAFDRLLEARLFDLYDDPMPDRAAYEQYAGETGSALMQLCALVLDPDGAPKLADACGHAGIALSVAGHLMLLPLHRRRGQVFLPGDLLTATGLDRETFLAGEDAVRTAAAISAFVAFGREHLAAARTALDGPQGPGRHAVLPAAIAPNVLARAERTGAKCLTDPPQPSLLSRQWRLWRASRNGTI